MKFKGCKYLDFEDNYVECKKVLIDNHVCWERNPEVYGYDNPMLVQFCKKRGRLNCHDACIGKENAVCDDYEEKEFEVN